MTAASLPYGHHTITDEDVAAVRMYLEHEARNYGLIEPDDIDRALTVLRSDLLAQGPVVQRFENAFAAITGAEHAVACSSGTSALHLALASLGVGVGDTCIAPAVTFISTASAARFCGADVIFADVDPQTGLMTADTLTEALKRAKGPVKAVLPVHLGGRLCDMAAISTVARKAEAKIVEDACHALGSEHRVTGKAGECRVADASVFSFHPVKTIACGEGGMVTTNSPELAARLKRLRNHGVTRDPDLMSDRGLSFDRNGNPNPWSYEQLELGFNYRMNELEAALGESQLGKLEKFVTKRRELVDAYERLLAPLHHWVRPIRTEDAETTSFHLFAVEIVSEPLVKAKAALMRNLARRGIGTQVHYIPVYRQPYFRKLYGYQRLAGAESYFESALTLPLFPRMSLHDVERVTLVLAAEVSNLVA